MFVLINMFERPHLKQELKLCELKLINQHYLRSPACHPWFFVPPALIDLLVVLLLDRGGLDRDESGRCVEERRSRSVHDGGLDVTRGAGAIR